MTQATGVGEINPGQSGFYICPSQYRVDTVKLLSSQHTSDIRGVKTVQSDREERGLAVFLSDKDSVSNSERVKLTDQRFYYRAGLGWTQGNIQLHALHF